MNSFFKRLFKEKREINYLYFSGLLIFLAILSLSPFFSWEGPLNRFSLFFVLYGLGQALLEIFCFIFIALILDQWAPRFVYLLFIGISFLLMLLHFTQFLLVRVMDTSLSYLVKFFFGSGLDHLMVGFQALNLNWTMILISAAAIFLIPIAGIFFHLATDLVVKHKPLNLSLKEIGLGAAMTGVFLFSLDLISLPFLNQGIYTKYKKILPLGTTFLSPTFESIHLLSPLPPPRDEEKTLAHLPQPTLSHLPNIYLFVIETFRRDFLSFAPNLSSFGEENIHFARSFANASSTHLSWFSIFHANLPLYWTAVRDTWKQGSIPLQILKNLGYKLSVFSSADLRFYNMDKLLFGAQRELIDQIEEYTVDRNLQPFERDRMALKALKESLKKEGHIYLIFLDATHSEYSFPSPPKYTPISKEIDYLTIHAKSPEIELIKNRYRNSIDYIDQLLGEFFHTLKENHLYEDAIIAITGDHGEEFFEQGALFHGTHLNDYQTAVPLFFKFPSQEWVPQTEEATHLDIFPSILHYLTKESDFASLFDGRSIFSLTRLPFRISVLQNGPDAPSEFTLETPTGKLRAEMIDSSHLKIVELEGMIQPDIFSSLRGL